MQVTENVDVDLERLFRQCDSLGLGYIGPENLRQVCANFNISPEDSDALFAQLDHDQDGKVNFEDFAWGFREFYSQDDDNHHHQYPRPPQKTLRHYSREIKNIFKMKNDQLNREILNSSGPKLAELYEQLQTSPDSRHLFEQFEQAIGLLSRDITLLEDTYKKQFEDSFKREKERHISHLKKIEEELDIQMANVEREAIEKAKADFEKEKRGLEESLTMEISELQAHLKLLEKINCILSKRQSISKKSNMKNTQEDDLNELRKSLTDTKTHMLLLQTELSQIKTDYHKKCQELINNQLDVENFQLRNQHVEQQLELLQKANFKLQDNNDFLLNEPEAKLREERRRHSTSAMEKLKRNFPSIHSKSFYYTSSRNLILERQKDEFDSGISTNADMIESDKSLQEELEESESFLQERENSFRRKIKLDDSLYVPAEAFISHKGPIDRTFRIVLAGDAAVGKTCFISRFCSGKFSTNLGSTLGVDFQIKNIRINNKNIAIQLWDTAGQEKFRAMTKSYFRRADGVILLYDITNERSFLNVRSWIQSINESTIKKLPMIICGNKSDLIEKSNKVIDLIDAERVASENNGIFFLTSCKTGSFIMDSVVTLAREMLTKEDMEIRDSSLKIIGKSEEKQSNCCKS